MAIEITKSKEGNEFVHRDGDAEIYYRIIPRRVREAIINKHTKRGVTDFVAVSNDSVQYAVTGWNDKVVADGEPFPFTKENALELPDSVRAAIIENSSELPADAEEREIKNS